jgi:alkylation response protein AidB-like acyl-CoA dehydrogenase
MSTYLPPLKDMRFVLNELAGMERVAQLPGCEEATPDVVEAILDEAAKFAAGVLAPLNHSGDREGAHFDAQLADKAVTMPAGFKAAYWQFVDTGWNALPGNPEYGGQGLPKLVSAAVQEMWKAANMAFSLCPMLTLGAADALERFGTEVQKQSYLANMISGKWTGTMNLTEPQAGSDLAAIRARAVPVGDGTYRIFGQKIFITYGEHDFTENIVHLVLARTPDAPEGVKGISLFVVPKFLVNADGSLGARNDVQCVSLEHKLGIHASPTCVMSYGEAGGALGTLVGQENEGLKLMFVMMNTARFAVGMEGLALAERATQQAVSYARDRVQGRAVEGSAASVAIIHHPDVRRMLMLMRCKVEAMRALAYTVAAAHDAAACHADAGERARNQVFVDLMIPVVKGWCTETGVEVASLAVQVHGGMGYMEETGVAQLLRDARITTIYEGTTGIQANDLIGRKIARDGGAAIRVLIAQMRGVQGDAQSCAAIAARLGAGIDALERAVDYIVAKYATEVRTVALGAVPFLHLLGIVSGGWLMARAALAAQTHITGGDVDPFYPAKIITAQFFAEHVLVAADGLADEVIAGGGSGLALGEAQF